MNAAKPKATKVINRTLKQAPFLRNAGHKTEIDSEWTDTDVDEREFGERLAEIQLAVVRPLKLETESEKKEAEQKENEAVESASIDAHESHRWSPVSHYLEPYL